MGLAVECRGKINGVNILAWLHTVRWYRLFSDKTASENQIAEEKAHLTHTDIDQRFGGRMGNLQQLHYGSTVVANGHLSSVED